MALKVEFNHPDFPKGEEIEVAGILVENGGSVELTEDQERSIAARRRTSARDAISGSPFAKVTGTALLTNKDIEEYLVEVQTLPVETAEAVEGGES